MSDTIDRLVEMLHDATNRTSVLTTRINRDEAVLAEQRRVIGELESNLTAAQKAQREAEKDAALIAERLQKIRDMNLSWLFLKSEEVAAIERSLARASEAKKGEPS